MDKNLVNDDIYWVKQISQSISNEENAYTQTHLGIFG